MFTSLKQFMINTKIKVEAEYLGHIYNAVTGTTKQQIKSTVQRQRPIITGNLTYPLLEV